MVIGSSETLVSDVGGGGGGGGGGRPLSLARRCAAYYDVLHIFLLLSNPLLTPDRDAGDLTRSALAALFLLPHGSRSKLALNFDVCLLRESQTGNVLSLIQTLC